MAKYDYLEAVKNDIRKYYKVSDLDDDNTIEQEIIDDDRVCGNWNGYKGGFENDVLSTDCVRKWLLENVEIVIECYKNTGWFPMLLEELLTDYNLGIWNIDAAVRSYLVPKALQEIKSENPVLPVNEKR